MNKLIAQLCNRCDFRVEYHEIEKKQEIVSKNKKVGNVSFAPRTYLLVRSKVANLGTHMSVRADQFLSQRLGEMYPGMVDCVRGNELTLPYYVLTQMRSAHCSVM